MNKKNRFYEKSRKSCKILLSRNSSFTQFRRNEGQTKIIRKLSGHFFTNFSIWDPSPFRKKIFTITLFINYFWFGWKDCKRTRERERRDRSGLSFKTYICLEASFQIKIRIPSSHIRRPIYVEKSRQLFIGLFSMSSSNLWSYRITAISSKIDKQASSTSFSYPAC